MLEAGGFVLRGRFSPGVSEDEYCARRLLARIHRYTLDRLRREIDPVSLQDYMRFLLRWQHLAPDAKLAGKQGVRRASGAAPPPRAGAAAEIYEALQQRGALFFDEIVNLTRRLRSDVERGLRELIAWGLVASDGFQGLRQLSGRAGHTGRRRGESSSYTAEGFFAGSGPAGRWGPVSPPAPH